MVCVHWPAVVNPCAWGVQLAARVSNFCFRPRRGSFTRISDGTWMDATHSGRSVYAVSGYLWGAGTIRRGGDRGQGYISYKLDAETRENASQWHDRISALRASSLYWTLERETVRFNLLQRDGSLFALYRCCSVAWVEQIHLYPFVIFKSSIDCCRRSANF